MRSRTIALYGSKPGGHRRPRTVADLLEVPVQFPLVDPAVDRLTANLQLARDLRHRQTFAQVVSQKHASLPSDHRRLPSPGGRRQALRCRSERLLRTAYGNDRCVTFSAATDTSCSSRWADTSRSEEKLQVEVETAYARRTCSSADRAHGGMGDVHPIELTTLNSKTTRVLRAAGGRSRPSAGMPTSGLLLPAGRIRRG